MLEVSNIQQYYGGSHILRDVSLKTQMGKVTVLLGRNGVGKTTLLKSLMGLIPIRSGSISFAGSDISRAAPYERTRAGIGYVPQGREIFARLSVEDNLRMGLAYKSASEPIPAELFELFPVLKQMLGIQPSIIKDIGRVIRMLADRGDMAILLVEQYYDFAEELADDYLVMERGQFIAQGLGSQMQENGVRQLVAI